MPYVAACVLRDGGRRVEPGDDLGTLEHWSGGALQTALKNGLVVFVPPQLLGAVDVAPAQAASPAPGATPQKKRR